MIRWKSRNSSSEEEAAAEEAVVVRSSSSSSRYRNRVPWISTNNNSNSSRSYYSTLIALFVIFNAMQVSYCLGGVFELRLRDFSNPSGRDMDGNCCVHHNERSDNSATSTSASDDVCGGGLCTTKFRVCVKHYQVTIDHNPPCTFGEATTTDLFSEKHVNQEFKFPFNFRWPGTFSLIIEAWHHNSPAAGPVVVNRNNDSSSLSKPRLVSRMGIQQYLDVGDKWRPREWTGNEGQVSLSYEYRVTCLPDYYGDACDKTCKPRNDIFGHYTCSDQGDKICLPGWNGSYCENPVCRPGCQGTCTIPDTCECHSGWEGPYCSECVRYPGCKHGRCNNPWECNCEEGWGGLFCNQDLNYCTNHKPCRNGGTCFNTGQGSYTCSCPVGFIGADCETRADGCTCLNGGTCRENGTAAFCQCPEGWSGLNCELASFTCDTTPSPCANGGTCSEESNANQATCVCAPGYGGVRCETQISDNFCQCLNGGTCTSTGDCICPPSLHGPKCASSSPVDSRTTICSTVVCSNGGTCIPNKATNVNTLAYTCDCPLGWTGEFCTVPVNICATLPCANGGTCSPLPQNKYKCECPRHFGGPDCSEPCDCENGATCETANVCVCQPGFTGTRCQVATNLTHVTLGLQDAAVSDETLSASHVILVVCVSVATPLLVVVAVAVVLILKKRKRTEQRRNDDLARKQNEQNTLHSVTKKCIDPHMIVNTFDDNVQPVRTSNKCSNLDLSFKADQNAKNFSKCEFRNNSNSQLHIQHQLTQCGGVDNALCSATSNSHHHNPCADSKSDFFHGSVLPPSSQQQQQQQGSPGSYHASLVQQAQQGVQGAAPLLRSNPSRYSTYSYQLAPSSTTSLHHHLSTAALRNSLLLNSSSSAETSPASTTSSTYSNLNNNSPVMHHHHVTTTTPPPPPSDCKNNINNNNNLATEV